MLAPATFIIRTLSTTLRFAVTIYQMLLLFQNQIIGTRRGGRWAIFPRIACSRMLVRLALQFLAFPADDSTPAIQKLVLPHWDKIPPLPARKMPAPYWAHPNIGKPRTWTIHSLYEMIIRLVALPW
jgi:hypothetical protein